MKTVKRFAYAKSAIHHYNDMTILQEKYKKEIVPALQRQFNHVNSMAVSKVEKVVINVGVGKRNEDEQKRIAHDVALIAGQQLAPRPAQKSIASFKIRQGQVIGFATTLRGRRMYDFLERLILIALPRTRDFRGVSLSSVDSYGNLTIGVKEHIVFPEMLGEDTKLIFGFEATVVTNTKSREEAIVLLRAIGIPFKKE